MSLLKYIAPACVLATCLSAQAQATAVTFESATQGATVDNYYSGGTDSAGAVGVDLGIAFSLNDWVVIPWSMSATTSNIAYDQSGSGSMNFTNGISNIEFSYGAFQNASISFYSGANGTGSLVNTYLVSANNPGVAFGVVSYALSSVANSAVVTSMAGTFGIDNISFAGAGAVPEAPTWALMILGFGVVASAMRKHKAQGAAKAAFAA